MQEREYKSKVIQEKQLTRPRAKPEPFLTYLPLPELCQYFSCNEFSCCRTSCISVKPGIKMKAEKSSVKEVEVVFIYILMQYSYFKLSKKACAEINNT